jgi:hypothetical protein
MVHCYTHTLQVTMNYSLAMQIFETLHHIQGLQKAIIWCPILHLYTQGDSLKKHSLYLELARQDTAQCCHFLAKVMPNRPSVCCYVNDKPHRTVKHWDGPAASMWLLHMKRPDYLLQLHAFKGQHKLLPLKVSPCLTSDRPSGP